MITLSITKAHRDFHKLAKISAKYDEAMTITTKQGNLVLLSEKEYRNLVESFYLTRTNGVYNSIIDATKTPTSKLIKKQPWK